jgi:ABC-2 type transport system permease protein
MRLLLTAPLPRPWLLLAKLIATALLSLVQVVAFVAVAALLGTTLACRGYDPRRGFGGLGSLAQRRVA